MARETSLGPSVLAFSLVVAATINLYLRCASGAERREKEDAERSNLDHVDTPVLCEHFHHEKYKDRLDTSDLPTHVQREIYKDKRRQQMTPMITMKRQMYDNIIMTDPDGRILSTISMKKANWYVKRDLAVWIPTASDRSSESTTDLHKIRLLFEPATSGMVHNLQTYNVSIKDNCCVGCGDRNDYMRHYVVPYCYRVLLPAHFKTHLPHDIVIMCPDCHVAAEQLANRRMRALERDLRNSRADLHPTSAQAELLDKDAHAVRSAATALLKWKSRLPRDKIISYEAVVRRSFRKKDRTYKNEELTEVQLLELCKLESRQPNPFYVSGATLVVDSLRRTDNSFDENSIEKFVKEWRMFFTESFQPCHLPKGWSVDAPVQSRKLAE